MALIVIAVFASLSLGQYTNASAGNITLETFKYKRVSTHKLLSIYIRSSRISCTSL
jgi:hypothetical protein